MCSLLATDNGVSTDLSLRDLTSEDIAELTNLILIDATAASVLTALEQPPTLDQEQQSEERRTSTPQPVAARKKPIRWDPNRARNQRKQELIYLRKQVADLETQLTAVQAKKPRLGDAQREPTVSDESTSIVAKAVRETSVIATAWHQIARRQNQKRVEVERENVRLRVVLENQLKIAKSLESFLIRKIATKAEKMTLPTPRKHLYHMYPVIKDHRTDSEIFDDLAEGLSESYAELDTLFVTTGLAYMEKPHFSAQIFCDGRVSMYLEIFANQVLPFDVRSTGLAVWQHFRHAKERTPSRHYYYDSPKKMEVTDNTIVETFNLVHYAKGTSANFRVNQIVQRHYEEERIVVVWRAFIDPVEFSDAPLSGVRFLEKGYIVIKKLVADAEKYTLLQSCYIINPLFSDGWTEDDHPQVGAVTDFVLSATAANISATSEMLETVLLEQTIKSS
uniref:START domain-containing protein n=1 Tax=Globisporangium ultimum (strain ATCC 200006 / CBS 805.95 / DAOM BR144) TaxID=431595 RepID=K3W8T8_GLOUD